ncbi:hypothetical protein BGX28_006774 [Mortierella sp. GBA30]|nr:hypothetical protein BGX28_006774 [Mortierella sp. GBA30]
MTGANNSLYLTPNVASREGLVEIKVGVLLPYSLPNNVTQQLTYSGTSAIRLAASEINEQRLIPGAYITLVLKDSFNGHDPENSGAAQAIFSTVALLQTEGGVSGVIGDVSSALTVQSALLTSRLSIPQCSFSAGSTQLSSKDDYGYFFRTIPTELMFGRVMMDFVANRGWQHIAVFYTGDALGSEMMDSIELQAKKKNITVGYKRTFWEMGTSSDVGAGLDALKDSGQRIVLIAAVGIPQIRLIIEAVRKGLFSKDYVWLTINQVTESLLGREGSPIKPADLNGLFMFDNMLRLHGYTPYEQFLDKWAALDPTEYPYAGERDISSNEAQAYSCMMVMANGFANAVRGNWTALHLLASGKLGPKLKPTAMNSNYTGPGGPMLFGEDGDVVYGNFILYNYQNGRVVSIGTSYSSVVNITSPPMYFDGTYTMPADSAPLKVLNPTFTSSIGMVIIAIAGLSILFSLATMGIVIVYRESQVIKASSPLFCCLELCGFILLYFSAIMALDIPTDAICLARPFTMNVGFVLVLSNIVAKNFRVYRIFHNIYVTKRVIRDSYLLKIVGSILTVNLIIMTVWFIQTPPTLQQTTLEDFTTYWDCSAQAGKSRPFFVILFIYNVSLLLVATILAYRNRNVAANYNECRQIAFVVYNIFLSGCIAMPTVFLPRDQYLTKFFLSKIVLLFGTTVSLMLMFLPKLWKLFSEHNKKKKAGAAEAVEESSFDGLFNNSSRVGWLGAGSNIGGGGSSSSVCQYMPAGRKGSVGTLEDDTLKESHMGYMSVKSQNRYLPFLASWCMRQVMLFPADKYFLAYELPENYILRVNCRGRHTFLLQVKDEERLIYWFSLFENRQGNTYSSASTNGGNRSVMLPGGHLPLILTQTRTESDNTLHLADVGNLQAKSLQRSISTGKIPQYMPDSVSRRSPSPQNQRVAELQKHRRTFSSYTMTTITPSPRDSYYEPDHLRKMLEPPAQQVAIGPLDEELGHSQYPLDGCDVDGSLGTSLQHHQHSRLENTLEDQQVEDEMEERELHFGTDVLDLDLDLDNGAGRKK